MSQSYRPLQHPFHNLSIQHNPQTSHEDARPTPSVAPTLSTTRGIWRDPQRSPPRTQEHHRYSAFPAVPTSTASQATSRSRTRTRSPLPRRKRSTTQSISSSQPNPPLPLSHQPQQPPTSAHDTHILTKQNAHNKPRSLRSDLITSHSNLNRLVVC